MARQNTPFDREQRGNATIYVLIVVALFAALAFTVSRQNDSSESSALSDEQADIIAGQMIAYPYQVTQAIEMMTMTGEDASTLDFIPPDDAAFDTPPHSAKVFHPGGGGLVPARLPEDAIQQIAADPPAGWYLGRFSNVEWTLSAEQDVILVAYQIQKNLCEKLNRRLTGSAAIPALAAAMNDVLIDETTPAHGGNNVDFTVALCGACEEKPALCVSNGAATAFSFYSIILNR